MVMEDPDQTFEDSLRIFPVGIVKKKELVSAKQLLLDLEVISLKEVGTLCITKKGTKATRKGIIGVIRKVKPGINIFNGFKFCEETAPIRLRLKIFGTITILFQVKDLLSSGERFVIFTFIILLLYFVLYIPT